MLKKLLEINDISKSYPSFIATKSTNIDQVIKIFDNIPIN